MKEKIGIALLILLNAGFIYLMIILAILGYGLINGHHGLKAVETADLVTKNLSTKAFLLSFIVLASNYIIFRFLILNKRAILGSVIVTLIGILISTPFFFRERQSFIDYQHSHITLSDYIHCDSIAEVWLLRRMDTIPITYQQEFFQIIGVASYQTGMWKYQRSIKIKILKKDGTKDSILTNGDLFELSGGKFFKSKENLIEKYIQVSHSEKH